ncbi:GL20298 [Drosophila persimilis]|uniref:GL20298 n=1 Tax=Drosophila persimilis TaxID=7234 RepID=B4GXJ9_DROPE|nr:GL20298 [Drosophila persimilis]
MESGGGGGSVEVRRRRWSSVPSGDGQPVPQHTGLHALRQVTNETELIYRGSHSNGTVNELPSTAAHHQLLAGRIPQQQQQQQQQYPHQHHHQHQQPHHQQQHQQQVSSIAGTGSSATDALIGTIATSAGGGCGSGGGGSTSTAMTALGHLKKSNTQRSIEIIVDATQCGKEVGATATPLDPDDVEQGGGGQESSSSLRKSSRHRHRPLHRRLISYLRNLFQGSTTQTAMATLVLAWHCLSKRKR